jgi:hypothetical protein
MNLSDIIVASGRSGIAVQSADGSMPAGHNGPYNHKQTPVRNTAHWLITFLKAWRVSGEYRFRRAGENCLSYLLSDAARPEGAAFWCRDDEQRDKVNGLIGQAWVIEALCTAAEELGRDKLHSLAAEVFKLHRFDGRSGLWQKVLLDGSPAGADMTFNHQLWFAAAGTMIKQKQDSQTRDTIQLFLNKVSSKFKTARDGRIFHPLVNYAQPKSEARRIYKRWRKRLSTPGKSGSYKEAGYHAFNLYAFAILKKQFADARLWDSGKFNSALNYIFSREYECLLESNDHSSDVYYIPRVSGKLGFNRYGYAYNPPGLEIPFVLDVFFGNETNEANKDGHKKRNDKLSFKGDMRKFKVVWLKRQFSKTLDRENYLMTENTEDPETLSARIYEATRIEDLEIGDIND